MIDIVIPAFNSVDMTWRCLLHLFQFGLAGQRIVLVDDGSTDHTHQIGRWLVQQGHHYIAHPRNLGCHAAWNTGWKDGSRPTVLFINNDIAVLPRCLPRMFEEIASGERRYVSANQIIGAWDPGWLLAQRGEREVFTGPDYCFNSCFMVRRSLLEALGGFDEQFYLVYGDTDFVERMRAAGMGETCVVADALAFHGGSVTRRRQFGRDVDTALEQADRKRFEDKWRDNKTVLERHPPLTIEAMKAGRDEWWKKHEAL